MQITFLKSKVLSMVAIVCLSVFGVTAYASELSWSETEDGKVSLKFLAGGERVLEMPDGIKGVFFDGVQHYVDGDGYLSVIQVADSKPEEPESVCGAGNEVWLQVYKGNGELSSRILVSSCLEPISLASQNSGLEEQDNDFSSIKWSEDGISIKWFSKKDCDGRSLSATHYKICGDLFCASDVLERSEAE